MKLPPVSRVRTRPARPYLPVLAICFLAALNSAMVAQQPAQDLPKVALTSAPDPIYSDDPDDSWNRVFYFLFSRRLEIRLSDEFPEGAPFVDGVSTRSFEREEVGDRAIDPLYPSELVSTGERVVLNDPAYHSFIRALLDALHDNRPRSLTDRALMQNDLWGAYDILFWKLVEPWETELGQRRRSVLDLSARLIKKIALTPEEIRELPDNYSAAVRNYSIPDVFRKDSGWIEVQWFVPRAHDEAAGFRRVSRVFLKPTPVPRDIQRFLDDQPGRDEGRVANPVADLDGVALVTQLIVIDAKGKLQPSTLTSEVQVRRFEKKQDGVFKKTSMQVCEISRKLFTQDPESGGLIVEDENSRAYLGHYTFAAVSPEGTQPNFMSVIKPPVQAKLRTRCAQCHLDDLTQIMTFSIARPPNPPPVRQLNPASNDIARIDIAQKIRERNFQSLLAYFDREMPRH